MSARGRSQPAPPKPADTPLGRAVTSIKIHARAANDNARRAPSRAALVGTALVGAVLLATFFLG